MAHPHGICRFSRQMRATANARRINGFTLVELLTVVVIIGILCATAMANFVSAQKKAKNAMVIDNMHAVQIGSEAYATDSGGIYSATAAGIAPYMPGGGNTHGGAAGHWPVNPISGGAGTAPFAETIADSPTIQAVRTHAPTASPGPAGQVGYNQCDTGGISYCVTGATTSDLRSGGGSYTLVLSNH